MNAEETEMITHSLGVALIAVGTLRRPIQTEAAEDAYYRQHMPVVRRLPRELPVIAAVCLGFVAAGLWLQ